MSIGLFFELTGISKVRAQPTADERVAEEPTGGVNLPTSGISGEVDAFSTVTNPAQLRFQSGWHLGVALDAGFEEEASGGGRGWGAYLSSVTRGPILRGIGWGMSLESLSPPRTSVSPDPGEPVRYTSSIALPMGTSAALGFSWHHFFGSGPLGGLDTYDLGLSLRFGSHFGVGAVVRDLTSPEAANTPVQRRYEAEFVSRPLATDRLEVALGGRIGETRADIDGWLRGSLRVVKGAYLRAQLESRELTLLSNTATGTAERDEREWRASVGLELSFGGLGVAGYANLAQGAGDDGRILGGTVTMRLSKNDVPSIIPSSRRIEPISLGGPVGQRTLTRLVGYLRNLERDDKVAGVFFKLNGYAGGWSTTRELRQRILALRASGKKVYAHMVQGSTRQYYLASAADKIFMDPAGLLQLQGLSATSLYFKGVFDKLGVEAQFEKIEEFKSAPEAWTRRGPTPTAERMRDSIYDSIYDTMIADIAAGRKMSGDQVRKLIDAGPYTPNELTEENGLVDAIVMPDEVGKKIEEDLLQVTGERIRMGRAPRERPKRWSWPKIAVVYISGDIVNGRSQTVPLLGRRLVGGDTIRSAIARARADRSVKAIILRINSPGGSALASELMAREVFKAAKVKPVICSMGNVAASGGYFAAAGCEKIFASRMTITGSIGIFNGKFDVSGLLSRLGLSWTIYKRGKNADSFSFYRPFTAKERATLKVKIGYFYDRFIGAVAEGRKMTKEQVNEVGRGHVWTGEQALGINLVDQIGGISEAIDYAKSRAGFKRNDRVVLMSLPQTSRSLLSKLIGGSIPGLGASADSSQTEPSEELFGAASDSVDEFGALRFFDSVRGDDILAAGSRSAASWQRLFPGNLGRQLADAIPASMWVDPASMQARLPFAILWE